MWCEIPMRLGFGKQQGSSEIFYYFKTKGSFTVGSGIRVKFRKDRWCNEEPLCETFPLM